VRRRVPPRYRICGMMATLGMVLGLPAVSAPAAQAQDMRQREWYLSTMQAPQMWKVSTGAGVTVAVIDNGVDASAPELQGRVLPGKDFVTGTGDARQDAVGHGTAMAMLIAGSGVDGGVMGLAPGAQILPLRIGGLEGVPEIADAIRYAADHHAMVINISQVVLASSLGEQYISTLQSAVNYALSRGSLIFAGSGNSGDKGNPVDYPAALPGVVGVGAVDESGAVMKFSTYGRQVALAAPGKDMPGRCMKELGNQTGYCLGAGTSEATAIASASAALIRQKYPNWTADQVLRVLINTAGRPVSGPIPSPYVGYGVVRPRVAILGDPGDPGPPNINPLLAAAKSPSPTQSAGGTEASTGRPSGTSTSGNAAVIWVATGIAGIAMAGGLAAWLLIRRRRRSDHPSAPAENFSYPAGSTSVQPPPPPPAQPGQVPPPYQDHSPGRQWRP
jgi:type VII secretion-associated serine protease mycosin